MWTTIIKVFVRNQCVTELQRPNVHGFINPLSVRAYGLQATEALGTRHMHV
jgi:hypothetical protein